MATQRYGPRLNENARGRQRLLDMGRGRAVRIGDGELCMPVSKSYSNGDNKMSVSDKSTMATIIPRNPFAVSMEARRLNAVDFTRNWNRPLLPIKIASLSLSYLNSP